MWFLRTVEQHRVNKEKDEVVGIQIRAVIEEINRVGPITNIILSSLNCC
jgi:hypothetical protein